MILRKQLILQCIFNIPVSVDKGQRSNNQGRQSIANVTTIDGIKINLIKMIDLLLMQFYAKPVFHGMHVTGKKCSHHRIDRLVRVRATEKVFNWMPT